MMWVDFFYFFFLLPFYLLICWRRTVISHRIVSTNLDYASSITIVHAMQENVARLLWYHIGLYPPTLSAPWYGHAMQENVARLLWYHRIVSTNLDYASSITIVHAMQENVARLQDYCITWIVSTNLDYASSTTMSAPKTDFWSHNR